MDILDYRGNKIVPTARVAFNLSGAVALGEIVTAKITKSTPTDYLPGVRHTYDIRVRLIEDHPYHSAGHISKIRNPLNLVRV